MFKRILNRIRKIRIINEDAVSSLVTDLHRMIDREKTLLNCRDQTLLQSQEIIKNLYDQLQESQKECCKLEAKIRRLRKK